MNFNDLYKEFPADIVAVALKHLQRQGQQVNADLVAYECERCSGPYDSREDWAAKYLSQYEDADMVLDGRSLSEFVEDCLTVHNGVMEFEAFAGKVYAFSYV